MNVLLLTIGSAGDVHPFIGLGLALKRRGHRVKVITNPYFGDAVARCGLELVPLGTVDLFRQSLANPDLWHVRRGTSVVFDLVLNGLRETYDAVASNYIAGETVLVSSSLGLAGRIAQDKLKIPTATVHLSPAQFRSLIAPPILPGLWMPAWLPMWVKRQIWAGGDRFVIDRMLAPRINQLRRDVNLPAVDGILREFWNSPDLVLGLFPDWFCPPQTDWPPQTQLTGFPLYDESDTSNIDPVLDDFLHSGPPPIVFTPGSAMHHGHRFFASSVKACLKLQSRGILLTRHAEQLPKQLPDSIRHFEYAPFSRILPRVAALVHHGGIGTSAQAMAAGCRQLVTPFAHDQFDNAQRLQQLGVARVIKAKSYTASRAMRELALLLRDDQVTGACRSVASKFEGDRSIEKTCGLIESLMPKSPRM